MVTLPKDRTDLQLAPLILALDRRLDEFELFDLGEAGATRQWQVSDRTNSPSRGGPR